MKIKSFHIVMLAAIALGASCKKDNYEEPTLELKGNLQYNGENINVQKDQVPYQLFQYGFDKVSPIGSTFSQEGVYGAKLYGGNYKFVIPSGQGPFRWKEKSPGVPDSLDVAMTGDQTLNIEVTPYYMLRNPQITGGGDKVTATVKADKIITDANAKDIERVTLYINVGQFVEQDNIGNVSIDGAAIVDPNNISLEVAVDKSKIKIPQTFVYARIGLKIAGVEDMIFTPVVKVTY